jgi:hypothetical protein
VLVTVADRSEACTVFARSKAGIVGSNPTQGMDVWCVCGFFCVCVVLCLVRGLATSWSPVQGVLQSVNYQQTGKSALCSKMGASPQVGVRGSKKKYYTVNTVAYRAWIWSVMYFRCPPLSTTLLRRMAGRGVPPSAPRMSGDWWASEPVWTERGDEERDSRPLPRIDPLVQSVT